MTALSVFLMLLVVAEIKYVRVKTSDNDTWIVLRDDQMYGKWVTGAAPGAIVFVFDADGNLKHLGVKGD